MSEEIINNPKNCPWCNEPPEVVKAKTGPYKDYSRSFHRCQIIGYIEIQDWTNTIDFTKWNTRAGQ